MSNTDLTITLTGRRPVNIVKDDWPIIASAEDTDDRAHPFQANKKWKLIVRQHADGRTIVYGVYTSSFQGERDIRGGELLAPDGPPEMIPDTIAKVGAALGFKPDLYRECIADLPAEDI